MITGYEIPNHIRDILRTLSIEGYQGYVVGGAVRDMVMGNIPKDYDIATNARANQLLEIFPEAKVYGKAYEIIDYNGTEIAPYRVDVVCDGRHAKVEFVDTIQEDLARRDLTINAMALGLDGAIIDLFNGIQDIHFKTIRFVGNPKDRIMEDYFRAIRAIRFASKLNFIIESNSMNAILKLNEKIIENTVPERVIKEITSLCR